MRCREDVPHRKVGCAPRTLSLPSGKRSVMIGDAAGLNLCSFEYLSSEGEHQSVWRERRDAPRGVDDLWLWPVLHRVAHGGRDIEQADDEDEQRDAFPGRGRRRVEAWVGLEAAVQLVDVARGLWVTLLERRAARELLLCVLDVRGHW